MIYSIKETYTFMVRSHNCKNHIPTIDVVMITKKDKYYSLIGYFKCEDCLQHRKNTSYISNIRSCDKVINIYVRNT